MNLKSPQFRKRLRRVCVVLVCATIMWFFAADWLISSNAEGKLFNYPENCPSADVGLVLGTSPTNRSGTENAFFSLRMDAAAALYKNGKIKYILASGDHGSVDYDETAAMKKALIQRGVPASRIYLDHAGFRTLDSMVRAMKVFGQKRVIVISQQFHNERAIYLGEHVGMKVYGYNARGVRKMRGILTHIRERFARMKVFWDIAFGVEPKFLGPAVKIG